MFKKESTVIVCHSPLFVKYSSRNEEPSIDFNRHAGSHAPLHRFVIVGNANVH